MTIPQIPLENQPTTSTESFIPSNPPTPAETPAPTPPAPDDRALLLQTYGAVISEKDREVARLQRELEEARRAPATPPPTAEEQSRQFFERPAEMIRSEVAAQIAPLNAYLAQTKREAEYAELKRQMRLDPRFAKLSDIESEFDSIMKNASVDPQTMVTAFYTALGIKAANTVNTPTPTPAPAPTPTPAVTTPPHLRPTNGAPIVEAPKAATRQLTENEKRLARMNGLSDEEYLKGLEGSFTVTRS